MGSLPFVWSEGAEGEAKCTVWLWAVADTMPADPASASRSYTRLYFR
jgi:hypothetical protein